MRSSVSPKTVVAREGHEIAYDVEGSADDTVVLLPGILMTRGRWRDVGYVERLSADYRVISIDPLGHGKSSRPHDAAAYNRAALVNHSTAVLDAEGVDAAHFWGYSRGGALAAAVAVDAPDRVRALVMGGTPIGDAYRRDDTTRQAQLDALRAGDWDKYWDLFPARMPPEVRAYMEKVNDPYAVAAVMGADTELQMEPGDLPAKTYAYFATGEAFADTLRRDLDAASITYETVDAGGHVEGFLARDDCLAFVLPVLQRH